MANQIDLCTIDLKIQIIKKAAKELALLAGSFPSVEKKYSSDFSESENAGTERF